MSAARAPMSAVRAASVYFSGSETTNLSSTLGGWAGPKVRVLSMVGGGLGSAYHKQKAENGEATKKEVLAGKMLNPQIPICGLETQIGKWIQDKNVASTYPDLWIRNTNQEIAQGTDLGNLPSWNRHGGIFRNRNPIVAISGYLGKHIWVESIVR